MKAGITLVGALLLALAGTPPASASPLDCDQPHPVDRVTCMIEGLADGICWGTFSSPVDGLTAFTPWAGEKDGNIWAGLIIADGGSGQATPTGFNTHYSSFVIVGAYVPQDLGKCNEDPVESDWGNYWLGQICIPGHISC